ncbi:MAG TPA: hypothetical protein VG944_10600, partial [Fimbriimonas sp.]|nr:hypothetical protein [Fimbriimonas sp.]
MKKVLSFVGAAAVCLAATAGLAQDLAGVSVNGPSRPEKPLIVSDNKFKEILSGLLAASARYESKSASKDYDTCDTLGRQLYLAATSSRSKLLIKALIPLSEKSIAKVYLLGALGKVGDPKEITPYFLKEIEGVKVPSYEEYLSTTFVAREYLLQCIDPRAVDYFLSQLTDPKADRVIQEEAYRHVAGTGGDRGAQAVLALRLHRTLLRPVEERVLSGFVNAGEMGGATVVSSQKKDRNGHTWGLLMSAVLGNFQDLWLTENVNGKWVHPVFTGVAASNRRSSGPKDSTETLKFEGKTGSQLLATDWVKLLVGNPKLARRSNPTELTDLERTRLGLTGRTGDADGDGDPDAVDPWPNAPNRTLSDAEQVLAAAFEARFHFDHGEGPAVFEAPADMKPFEMVGRRGPTLWVAAKKGDAFGQLRSCFNHGTGFISFAENPRDKAKPWEGRLIRWSKDRSCAEVD